MRPKVTVIAPVIAAILAAAAPAPAAADPAEALRSLLSRLPTDPDFRALQSPAWFVDRAGLGDGEAGGTERLIAEPGLPWSPIPADAVDRSLWIGEPPGRIGLLEGGWADAAEAEALAAELGDLGLVAEPFEGRDSWRGPVGPADDPNGGEVDDEEPEEEADPSEAGDEPDGEPDLPPVRVARDGAHLLVAAEDAALAAVLGGGGHVLADDTEIAALLAMLAAPELDGARLLQAMLIDGAVAGPAPAEAAAQFHMDPAEAPMPAYGLLLVADLQQGPQQVAVMALTLGSPGQAALAAETLPERWAEVASAGGGPPFGALLPAAATLARAGEAGGVPTVLFVVRQEGGVEEGAGPGRLLLDALLGDGLPFATPTGRPMP